MRFVALALATVTFAFNARAAVPLAWEAVAVSFEVQTQSRGFFGCGMVNSITRDILDMHGARRVRLSCDDRSRLRTVFMYAQFEAPRVSTVDLGEFYAEWRTVHMVRDYNPGCDVMLTAMDALTPSFKTENARYSAFCNGGGGTFQYSADILLPLE